MVQGDYWMLSRIETFGKEIPPYQGVINQNVVTNGGRLPMR